MLGAQAEQTLLSKDLLTPTMRIGFSQKPFQVFVGRLILQDHLVALGC